MTNANVIPGPCCICGLRDYALSAGGPSICPSCDCGHTGPTVIQHQAKRIAELEIENTRLQEVVKDLASRSPAQEDRADTLAAAIDFAMNIEDPFWVREWLRNWSHGNSYETTQLERYRREKSE